MAKIIIPTPLRKYTENQGTIEVSGENISAIVEDLAAQFPGIRQHIYDGEGNIRKFLRIYVGDEDIKALDNEHTAVAESATVSIIPAIAGGIR
ncbi:MoaD/ThiS family protein [Flammeovirgaceae bacterium SG7u.111]|nr:MoaD/ThiS family protein [Flammeovirgaceae bacterium SG7u.132]WPO35755.1 MoaD/ThiS family protein [Flammeovirgaceae bacterium SG7u.111]